MTPREYQKLLDLEESATRELDEERGAQKQRKADLEKEFQVSSLKEAEKKLLEMERLLKKQEAEYEKEMESFREEYGEKLI